MAIYHFTLDELKEAMDQQSGFCTTCGEEADAIELDAREYRCSACGENTVYGAGELILMGLVKD